ncbi:methyl-accepting chemotaxis protein [Chromobacterium amazonense]|uniref:Methyl-accepting chemotaxis protein n=1 Tax=Chromobacterium amazonense TaxID=1382803 RepID=A0ABU8V300_9NEIS|nr:methyl-accepting chemotaxis protein [Chromobacterium amazonense]KIA78866.1 hypothetical protein QR66_19120 [Chromobacterium piscinae]MBM2883160.1 HAMP domain-containing protein [Chromobacterium amazonense]MDQ4539342.1 methyl-accepting chemotaxis protein [Chromobacterium amazonense]
MSIRWGLQAKLSLCFTVLTAVVVLIYSVYAYHSTLNAEMDGINRNLLTSAYATQRIIGEHFHDKLPDRFDGDVESTKRLTTFVHQSELAYVYSTILRGSKVLYTHSSASPDEEKSGKYQRWFLAEYPQVPTGLRTALEKGSIEYEDYKGEYGWFRSAFVPFTTPDGMRYVIGADMSLEKVHQLRNGLLLHVSLVALAVLGVSLLLANLVARQLVSPINEASEALTRLADGDWDLTSTLTVRHRDEVGMIAASFNTFMAALRDRMREIWDESHALSELSARLAGLVDGVNQRSLSQADMAQSSSASIDELAGSVGQIADISNDVQQHMHSFSHTTRNTVDSIRAAAQVMNQVQGEVTHLAEDIQHLNQQTADINRIVSVIKDIADQTNLLALNAAIEAARAGEMGRGFAVVADEVRDLSMRTSQATVEIGQTLIAIQQSASNASKRMHEAVEKVDNCKHHADSASDTLTHFADSIGETVNNVGNITTAVQGQASAYRQLAERSQAVSEAAAGNRDAASHAQEEVSSLKQRTATLHQVVNRFTL